MTVATDEDLRLPETAEATRHILNTQPEIAKWIRAGRLSQLQDHYNELTRPELPQQMTDILQAFMDSQGMIEDRIQTGLSNALRQHGVTGRPALSIADPAQAAASRNSIQNDYARRMGEIGFGSLGDFVREVYNRDTTPGSRYSQIDRIRNEWSVVDPAMGGNIIPEAFSNEIRMISLEGAIVRPRATIMPMTAPILNVPSLDWTTNQGSVMGGFQFAWVDAGEEIPETSAKIARTKLALSKLAGRTDVPNELFNDAPSLNAFLMRGLPNGLRFVEDTAFLVGDGVDKPLGAISDGNGARILATRTGSPLDTDDVLNMYAQMLPGSLGSAVWIANQTLFPYLMTLTIDVGTGGAPMMLVQGGLPGGPPTSILGRPLILSEKVPAQGNRGDLNFVDFNYYLIGDGPGLAVDNSPHAGFTRDVTVIRVLERTDGRPWLNAPFQPLNGDPLSPMVVLDN